MANAVLTGLMMGKSGGDSPTCMGSSLLREYWTCMDDHGKVPSSARRDAL